MKKLALVFVVGLLVFGSTSFAHPLPEGFCDDSVLVEQCVTYCKKSTQTVNVFKNCFGSCLFNITCDMLSPVLAEQAQQTPFALKSSASDTPQIEGVWVGDWNISSQKGAKVLPVTMTITRNEFGLFEGEIQVTSLRSLQSMDWFPVEGTLSGQGLGLWSVSISGAFANGQGTFSESGPTFTLEFGCTRSVFNTVQTELSCPWDGSGSLTRQSP